MGDLMFGNKIALRIIKQDIGLAAFFGELQGVILLLSIGHSVSQKLIFIVPELSDNGKPHHRKGLFHFFFGAVLVWDACFFS
jgi:hypothetical protein